MNRITKEVKIFASNGSGNYIEILIAHNGTEVWAYRKSYQETEFDKIMADWREQERQRKRNKKITLSEFIFGHRRNVA